MPHVVQRCSSLGDSVGAGLSSPWLLFVAMHGGMVALLAARHEMPCGSCPASVSIPFPAMCASFSPLRSCHDISAGTVRQSVKREIPATLEDGDTGIVPFSVYTAGNRFPWTDVLFLCAVRYVCRQVVCAALQACRQRPKVFFISSTRSSFSHVKSSTSTSRVG